MEFRNMSTLSRNGTDPNPDRRSDSRRVSSMQASRSRGKGMTERCSVFTGTSQCRAKKDLTRCRITIHREPNWVVKLPDQTVIFLCPRHFLGTEAHRNIGTPVSEMENA